MKLGIMQQPLLEKPFSQACVENAEPLLAVLREVLAKSSNVLEIGTGTGQHAVTFGRALQHLSWQTSDQSHYHSGIEQWLADAELGNVLPPMALNVSTDSWPEEQYDAIFSANTMHIMSWGNVKDLFAYAPNCLVTGGQLICYGPFNIGGDFTSRSNEFFDKSLRNNDPLSGLRNLEDLNELAEMSKLELVENIEMPANNRTLIWRKQA